MFAEADRDNTGELDIEEFRAKLKEIDPKMDDGLIEKTFQLVDEDGSGTVSYAEFRKHMWRRQGGTVYRSIRATCDLSAASTRCSSCRFISSLTYLR